MYTEYFCFLPLISLVSAIFVGFVGIRRFGGKGIILAFGAFGMVFALTLLLLNDHRNRLIQEDIMNTASARLGAFTTLDHLPIFDAVERVTVSDESFSSDIGGCCCYYGRLTILYGTRSPTSAAFAEFIQHLQTSGWSPEGTNYPESKGFIQGDYAYLNLDYNGGADALWRGLGKQSDYIAATAKYSGTLNMRIDYMLPSRKVCGGQ